MDSCDDSKDLVASLTAGSIIRYPAHSHWSRRTYQVFEILFHIKQREYTYFCHHRNPLKILFFSAYQSPCIWLLQQIWFDPVDLCLEKVYPESPSNDHYIGTELNFCGEKISSAIDCIAGSNEVIFISTITRTLGWFFIIKFNRGNTWSRSWMKRLQGKWYSSAKRIAWW